MSLSKEERKYYRRLFSCSDSFVLAGWIKKCLDDLDAKDEEIEFIDNQRKAAEQLFVMKNEEIEALKAELREAKVNLGKALGAYHG